VLKKSDALYPFLFEKLPMKGWAGLRSIASVGFFDSATPLDADKSIMLTLRVLKSRRVHPSRITQAAHSRDTTARKIQIQIKSVTVRVFTTTIKAT